MSMKAHSRTDSRGNLTIYLEGRLSFDNISMFKNKLKLLLTSNPGSTITLNLYKLDFVGSSGIGFFIKTIKEVSRQNPNLKVSNVKNEFLRVFKNHGIDLPSIMAENSDLFESPHLREKKAFQN